MDSMVSINYIYYLVILFFAGAGVRSFYCIWKERREFRQSQQDRRERD